MPQELRSNFATTDWLAGVLRAPDVVVVDGSWYLPAQNRNGRAEYLAGHIPGAVFFDIDAIADASSGLPHMLPSADEFAQAMRLLGISEDLRIVVYDGVGLFSAPRVWWTFKVFGAHDVVILDGGLPKWRAEGRPLEDGLVARAPRTFSARFDRSAVAGLAEVREALAGTAQVVDARPENRFRGEAPEPRPRLRSGHMPGSRNLPYSEVVADGRLKPRAELVAAFESAGVDRKRPIITSCGSGVSAAILVLALAETGQKARLYDGSWAEWGARGDLPVETGPPGGASR